MNTVITYITVNTITAAIITGKSLLIIAWKVIKPNPGHANTVSVTTVPAMNPATINAANVSGGINAFRNACFHIIVLELAPLARANLTNS